FLERLGQLNEVAGLHAVIRAALRLAAQVRSVTEHRGQRNVRAYYRGAVADVRAGDLAATGVYVAHYVAHILLRRRYRNLHDGLKQRRSGLRHGLLESHAAA